MSRYSKYQQTFDHLVPFLNSSTAWIKHDYVVRTNVFAYLQALCIPQYVYAYSEAFIQAWESYTMLIIVKPVNNHSWCWDDRITLTKISWAEGKCLIHSEWS